MKIKAFTMIEIMMALVVVSIMLAVLAPVITTPGGKTHPEVQVISGSVPVGAIVAWWGVNIPDGWLPLNGQAIAEPEYEALRTALGGLDTLPNLNGPGLSNDTTNWIIRAVK